MFNKETEYALRGLVYVQLQQIKGLKPGIKEIAIEIDAPLFYTGKILQRLVKMGFLQSTKGKGGGFYFDLNKPDVPLKSVIHAIEGDKAYTGCGFGLKSCSDEQQCSLHGQYAPIRASIDKLVSENTVQSLARDFNRGEDILLKRLKS